MSWTIKGEAGKTLDATVRTLESILGTSAKLVLSSLDADSFEWEASTSDATGAGTIIPDAGQIIEVFYSGTRRFYGNVTIPRVSTNRVTVRAEGAWWWMNRITLTQVQADDEATTATRPSYVFPTQALKTSLETLIDRAIANGVPVIRGTVATMFDFPRITLSEKSCAQALADLMSICPDAVAYFDYSGATGTYPILNITRRGVMSAETLTLGTDAVEDLDLAPRLELEVARVDIGSVTRNTTTGAQQWATQSSGTAAPGKNQIIVVSGPETVDFLPVNKDNSVSLQTFAMPTGGIALSTLTSSSTHTASVITGEIATFVKANDPAIATMIREFGSEFSSYLSLSNGGRFLVSIYTTGNMNGAPGIFLDKPNLISKESVSGMYVVSATTKLPQWMTDENGYVIRDATLSGFLRYTRNYQTTEPSWWAEGQKRAVESLQGYIANTSGQTSGSYQNNLFFQFAIPVQVIDTAFAGLTTVYRAWDYDYIQPPAGLAAALLAAQNWIPWDGNIQTVADTVDGAQDLLKKYNVAGSLTACSTMAALPRAITYDIARGRKTIRLGAPARTDFGSLASRFRRSPKDNITYL